MTTPETEEKLRKLAPLDSRKADLEEKLNLSVSELPFSEEVKEELQKKGVYKLQQIVDKLNRDEERFYLPGYKKRVWEEASCLAIEMGFTTQGHKEEWLYDFSCTAGRVERLEKHIEWLQEVLDRKKEVYERRTLAKERIDNYVNKEI